MARKGDFEHGGNQSSRDTVTCNVRNEDADPFVVQKEKVIEVACYGAHREITGRDFKLE